MKRLLVCVLTLSLFVGCASTTGQQPNTSAQPVPVAAPPPPPPPPPPPMPPPPPQSTQGEASKLMGSVRPRSGARPAGAVKPMSAARPNRKNYARMRVFYATDRAPARNFNTVDQGEKYTGARGPMAYGQAFVSIPRGHVPGELEAPSIFRLEFREDPTKHVVLLETTPQSKAAFLTALKARVAASKGRNLFLFVHGYNVSFADAARRTAQLSYDLSFDGAPMFFSWPSQAKLSGYTVDEANIEWSTRHIKQFIADMADQSGSPNIYLIGHSMGTRGLTRALKELIAERPDLKGRFREVILAAPDIDADVFRSDLAPALSKAGRRVTLYASSKDMALRASKKVHGYPRAGDAESGVLIVKGIDTIDASRVDDSILAHSYFVESVSVIKDIASMFRMRLAAAQRSSLRAIKTRFGQYWRIEPAAK